MLEKTMHLLLRRGANPNASLAPMPVIFFAVQFGDVGMVRLLIERGADPNCRMSNKVCPTPPHPLCPSLYFFHSTVPPRILN